MSGIRINSKLEIPEEQLEWSFARSSGPGGQNVNKVNSKATLRWKPAEGMLTRAVWRRFQKEAKRYLTTENEVVIQSQEHRDRSQNIESCRTKLRNMLRSALVPPKQRIATRPTLASRRRRLDNKRKKSEKKQMRKDLQ